MPETEAGSGELVLPSKIISYTRFPYIGERQEFLSCNLCAANNDASLWAVKAISSHETPVITALICPSCDHGYQVFEGQIRGASNTQLRTSPYRPYSALITLAFLSSAVLLVALIRRL